MSEAGVQASVVIERTYRARVEELWELWTTREGFESWWGPEGFRVEVHAIEPRVGGTLHYDMIADSPEMVQAMKAMGQPTRTATRGRFTELVPLESLAISHVIDFLPGVAPYENTIRVQLFASGPDVRMVVTLQPHPDPRMTGMAVDGFTSQLGKLDRRFGRS